MGNWKILNLCKPPHNWLSSWAGDYKNSLELIQKIQCNDSKISHLHYSGGSPKGNLAIQELLFSKKSQRDRLQTLTIIGIKFLCGYEKTTTLLKKIRRRLKSL